MGQGEELHSQDIKYHTPSTYNWCPHKLNHICLNSAKPKGLLICCTQTDWEEPIEICYFPLNLPAEGNTVNTEQINNGW